mgnify:CR=1 FL=1
MTDTTPHLPTKIQQELQKTITDIQTHVSHNHIDGIVKCIGFLRSGNGAKIRIENLEEMGDDDIECWKNIANMCGATNINYTADFANGNVSIDIEYKRPSEPIQYCEWLKYPLILAALAMSLKLL